MFYQASKLLWVLAQPSNLLIALLLLGVLARALGRRRLAGFLLYGGALVLLPVALLPVGEWLLLPLEERFPPPQALDGRIDGVIVLGGGIDVEVTAARGDPALAESAERFTALLELAGRYPEARLVFTGGADWRGGALTEAAAVRRFYQHQGIDLGRIRFEDRARNTHENALFSRKLVRPEPDERWLLVTSAAHMPRAVGTFRAAGWPVEAYPVDYRTPGGFRLWAGLDAGTRLKELDEAVKAWIGLVAYRLSGRSEALLPAP